MGEKLKKLISGAADLSVPVPFIEGTGDTKEPANFASFSRPLPSKFKVEQ